MEYVHTNVVPIQIATADAAYDFPLAHRVLGDLGIDFFVRPQKTAVRANTQFTRDDFRYDEGSNVYLCPGEKELRLRRLARSASGLFWEYQADKRDCAACPLHDKCLSENDRRGARKGICQLLYSRQTAQSGAPLQSGVPGGVEAAADLV